MSDLNKTETKDALLAKLALAEANSDSIKILELKAKIKNIKEDTKKDIEKILIGKKVKIPTHATGNFASFPKDIHIDRLTKTEEEKSNLLDSSALDKAIKNTIDKIREETVEPFKKKALKEFYRKKVETNENKKLIEINTEDLLALEEAKKEMADKIWKEIVEPITNKTFKEYYSKKVETNENSDQAKTKPAK